jgi:hypothetical protein
VSPRFSRLLPALAALLVVGAPAGAGAAKPRSLSLGDRLPLVTGDKGRDVKVLQEFLNRVGQRTAVDGVFGGATKRAVVAFERGQRLVADGTVTAEDVKVLRDVAVQGSAVASISALTVGPDGIAVVPAGAPPVVQAIIAAGNRIATKPYIYGGGHGVWEDKGYDCSGSVSYALHGGGLLAQSMISGEFMTWGAPGPGTWVTVYANGGHMYMVVAGLRFDTSGQRGAGTRWQADMRSGAGLSVRHPDGL